MKPNEIVALLGILLLLTFCILAFLLLKTG